VTVAGATVAWSGWRFERPPRRIALSAGTGLVTLGIAMALGATVLGPISAGLLLVAVAAVRRPTASLVVMVVVEVTNLADVVGDRGPGVFKIVFLMGLASAMLALRDAATRARVRRPLALVTVLLAVYLGSQAVAVLASARMDLAAAALGHIAVDCVFVLVLAALALISNRPWTLAAAIVLPFAALSALAVVNQLWFGGTATFGGLARPIVAPEEAATKLRQAGPLADANFWGRHLVVAVPLALTLLARAVRDALGHRIVGWAGALAALLGGVYLAQSRGTFLALASAAVVWVVVSGSRTRTRALRALPLLAPLVLVPGVGDRLVALVASTRSFALTYGVDASVLQRRAAQEIALAMFRDRPVLGVGPGVYESLVPSLAGKVATAFLTPTDAPHNLYAQLAAESGLVGLAGWLAMIGGFFALALGAVRRPAGGPPGVDGASGRQLAGAAVAGLVAWSLASVFLHLAHFRTFGVLLALVVCIAVAHPRGGGATTVRARRPSLAAVGGLAMAGVVGVAAGAALVAATSTTSFAATRTVTLVPVGPIDARYLDPLEVWPKFGPFPTYAELIAPGGSGQARAVADPVRGVITVSAEGPSPSAARTRLDGVMAGAAERLAATGADRTYSVRQVGVDTDGVRWSPALAGVVLALPGAGAVAGLVLAAAAAVRRRARRPSAAANVVVLVEFSPSGGLFQSSVQLGEALAADGHRVEVLTGPDPELAPRHPNLRIRSVLPTWHPGSTGRRTSVARTARRAWRAGRLLAAWAVLAVHLSRRPPRAVLFSHWRFTFEPLFVVWITRLLRRHSLVGIVAHEPLPRSDRKDTSIAKSGRLLELAFGAAWRRMDVAFVLGSHTRDLVRKHWDPPCEIGVIPCGGQHAFHGDEPVPPVANTAPNALFFGTWSRYKGIDVLLDAFERVRAAMPQARLVLAGAVGADVDLTAIVARATAVGGIELRPGYVPMADVSALYAGARLVVTPYLRATQSGVVHTAYTFGRPVVSSAVGDIPEVVRDGVNGLLVPPGDPPRLAAAMIELLRDAELAQRLGDVGRTDMETTWHTAATRIGLALDARRRM